MPLSAEWFQTILRKFDNDGERGQFIRSEYCDNVGVFLEEFGDMGVDYLKAYNGNLQEARPAIEERVHTDAFARDMDEVLFEAEEYQDYVRQSIESDRWQDGHYDTCDSDGEDNDEQAIRALGDDLLFEHEDIHRHFDRSEMDAFTDYESDPDDYERHYILSQGDDLLFEEEDAELRRAADIEAAELRGEDDAIREEGNDLLFDAEDAELRRAIDIEANELRGDDAVREQGDALWLDIEERLQEWGGAAICLQWKHCASEDDHQYIHVKDLLADLGKPNSITDIVHFMETLCEMSRPLNSGDADADDIIWRVCGRDDHLDYNNGIAPLARVLTACYHEQYDMDAIIERMIDIETAARLEFLESETAREHSERIEEQLRAWGGENIHLLWRQGDTVPMRSILVKDLLDILEIPTTFRDIAQFLDSLAASSEPGRTITPADIVWRLECNDIHQYNITPFISFLREITDYDEWVIEIDDIIRSMVYASTLIDNDEDEEEEEEDNTVSITRDVNVAMLSRYLRSQNIPRDIVNVVARLIACTAEPEEIFAVHMPYYLRRCLRILKNYIPNESQLIDHMPDMLRRYEESDARQIDNNPINITRIIKDVRGNNVTDETRRKAAVTLGRAREFTRIINLSSVTTSTHKPAESIQSIPRRIAMTLISDAIAKGEECAISLQPLDLEKTAITDCFHFYDTDAIQRWLKASSMCPQCRCNTRLLMVTA